MSASNCDRCPLRARYDRKPKSILGRLWHWHTNWCPGWRRYTRSLSTEERRRLADRYHMPRLR